MPKYRGFYGSTIRVRTRPKRTKPSALKLAKANRKMLNASREDKYIDIAPITFQPGTDFMFPLSQVATGATDITRIGEKIHARRLQLTVQFHSDTDVERVIVFRDKQNQGVEPAVTDVLQSNNDQAFPNRSNIERFHFYRDVERPHDYNLGSNNSSSVHRFDIPLNLNIHYIGDEANDASMGSNNLFLLVLVHTPSAVDTATYASRLTFTD